MYFNGSRSYTYEYGLPVNFTRTRAIPKVSGLNILENNIFHNLYISETYILYEV